jgi:dipeptidyl-peptidase-4
VSADGREVRALTSGDWMVDGIAGVDEVGGRVWFLATKDGATERHLYRVSLDGGEVRRITTAPGMHSVVMDHGKKRFVDVVSSLQTPPRTTLRSAEDGTELALLHEPADPRLRAYALPPPELVTLTNRAGTKLHGAVYRPAASGGGAPTLVSVYGGPHAQRVTNSWDLTADMRAQWLASQGFVVFRLDNRGSARRGLAFEGVIRGDLGHLELEDQVDGVRWLVDQGITDPQRVGIYGWSYGGYLAAMALARAPETFKVAIAGAPVVYWEGYDTHYTERYMGLPAENTKGYKDASVLSWIDGFATPGHRLLLVHGLVDENVHFRHSAALMAALNRKHVEYDALLFPDERHTPRREEDRVYMEQRLADFLVTHL